MPVVVVGGEVALHGVTEEDDEARVWLRLADELRDGDVLWVVALGVVPAQVDLAGGEGVGGRLARDGRPAARRILAQLSRERTGEKCKGGGGGTRGRIQHFDHSTSKPKGHLL